MFKGIFGIFSCVLLIAFTSAHAEVTLVKKPVVLGTGTMKSRLPSLSSRRMATDEWLVHRIHTKTQCTNAGGFLFSVGAGQICRLVTNSCPAGWSQYSDSAGTPLYRATAAKSCTGTNSGGCTGTASPASCSLSAHSLGPLTTDQYQCTYKRKAPLGGIDAMEGHGETGGDHL